MRMRAFSAWAASTVLLWGLVPAMSESAAAAPKPPEGVRALADRILRAQLSDGAIVQGQLPASSSRLVPYFANMAAHGLAVAYGATGDARYRDAARRWFAWYESHQNPDGTIYDYNGKPGEWKGTGDYDSTDSYAATYLEALWALHVARPDRAYLRERLPAVRSSVAAIELTMQPNGMTLAKPTYPVMYTMDNTETAAGLRAAERIEKLVGSADRAKACGSMARKMEKAVATLLWDPVEECYTVGLQPDGFMHKGFTKWYPDVMANLMAIGWLPKSPRHAPLLTRMQERFGEMIPSAVANEDTLGGAVWWGVAAMGAGDKPLLRRVQKLLRQIPADAVLSEPSAIGLALRILCEE